MKSSRRPRLSSKARVPASWTMSRSSLQRRAISVVCSMIARIACSETLNLQSRRQKSAVSIAAPVEPEVLRLTSDVTLELRPDACVAQGSLGAAEEVTATGARNLAVLRIVSVPSTVNCSAAFFVTSSSRR